MTQTAVFVVGMHRSGTSAATGALRLLGVDLAKTYQAQQGVNERGFWEHADIVDTHDDLLRVLGSAWDDILPIDPDRLAELVSHPLAAKLRSLVRRDFYASHTWGLKDPRICRLLPIWFELEKSSDFDIKCWLVTRNPEEVAASLARRNGFSIEKSMLLWLSHTLEAELSTRGRTRTHSTYDDLLSNPVAVYEGVTQELGLQLTSSVQERAAEIREFLSSDLRHHNKKPESSKYLDNSFESLASSVYTILSSEKGQISKPACTELDNLRGKFDHRMSQLDPVVVEHLRTVSAARGKYEKYFFEAYHSIWWKLASPFRAIEKLVRR